MENKINFVPSGSKVLVIPQPAEEKTRNGIIIPDTARRRANKGTVAAIGAGNKEYPSNLKIGDEVVYGTNFVEMKIDEVDYLIMNEYEILGIL